MPLPNWLKWTMVVGTGAGLGYGAFVVYEGHKTPKAPPAPPPKQQEVPAWLVPATFGKCLDASQGGGSGCPWIPGYAPPTEWKPPTLTHAMSAQEVVKAFSDSAGSWKPPTGWLPGMPIPPGYSAPKDWNPASLVEVPKEESIPLSEKIEPEAGSKGEFIRVGGRVVRRSVPPQARTGRARI